MKVRRHAVAARAVAALVLCGALSGCSNPVNFQTPTGQQPGDQFGPWIILGVLSRSTSTLSRADGRSTFLETTTVNVPPGTELIVPAVRGITTGFGSTEPADLSVSGGSFEWSTEDHNFGMTMINVSVTDIDAVDTSTTPPTQTATINVSALLTDDDGRDRWFGGVNYTLICLGRHP